MLGWTRFNASSVTKNEASIALSWPQNRTARRLESYERLRLGKFSVMIRVHTPMRPKKQRPGGQSARGARASERCAVRSSTAHHRDVSEHRISQQPHACRIAGLIHASRIHI